MREGEERGTVKKKERSQKGKKNFKCDTKKQKLTNKGKVYMTL